MKLKWFTLWLMAIAGAAHGQWFHETVDTTNDNYTTIALNQDGRPAIVYLKGSIPGNLIFAEHDGSVWQKNTIVTESMWFYTPYPSLDFDYLGRPHLAYYSPSPRYLRHAWRDETGWHTEVVDSSTGTNNRMASMAIGPNNQIHIAYIINGGTTVRYAYYDGTSWSKQTIPSTAYCLWLSIDVDSQNHPHIVTTGKDYYCNMGSGWLYDTLDYTTIVGSPTIRLDSQDHPHIIFYSGDAYHLWHNGSAWQLEVAMAHGWLTNSDLDANDKCHIVHSDYNQPCSLAYSTNASGAWTSEVISTTKKYYAEGNFKIAVGPGGTIHVVERDTVGSTAVIVYHRRPGSGVAAGQPNSLVPQRLSLLAAPNPFNQAVEIQYSLLEKGRASIDLYDLTGRHIKNLFRGTSPQGVHRLKWNGTDDNGRFLPAGVYIARLSGVGGYATSKIVKFR